MLRKWLALLALAAATMWHPPAAAQADAAEELRTFRGFADLTSGHTVRGGAQADKLLTFGRNAAGEVVVIEIEALALGGEWTERHVDAFALMRTRASTANGNRAPDPDDIAFVRRTGARIFIVGEWASPPIMWEVMRDGEQVRLREIDAEGEAGSWQTAAP